MERQGRHRYYRIASDEMAHAIEALGLARPPRPTPAISARAQQPLAHARTCYRHLAGKFAVLLRERLERDGLLQRAPDRYELSSEGLARLGPLLGTGQRALAGVPCLDWTERRHHVGGALGVAITRAVLDRGWLQRLPGTRALRITLAGQRGFHSLFGIEPGDSWD
jgi:hypothetical protein